MGDVVQIEKTKENFRMLYETKGRFVLHKIVKEEASYKLCRVKKVTRGPKGVPYAITHDGRTIRYPDPDIKANDTVKINIAENKVFEHHKLETGNVCMITGGFNSGRVGVITYRERHAGGYDIVHVKDSKGHEFATRLNNVFILGTGSKPVVSLPKGAGVRLSIEEEKEKREKKAQA